MTSILTEKYHTHSGAPRIKAYCCRGKYIRSPHGLNEQQEHDFIAHSLIERFICEDMKRYGTTDRRCSSFHHNVVSGSTKKGYAYVFLDPDVNNKWDFPEAYD